MKKKRNPELERATRRRAWVALVALVLVLIGIFTAIAAGAEELKVPAVETEPAVSYTLTTKALEKYLGSNGGVFHPHECFQPDLLVSLPRGFYADLWASRTEGNWWGSFGDEADLTLGKLGEGYDIGIAYFAIVEIAPADVVQLYAKFSMGGLDHDGHKLAPYLWLEHYFPTSGNSPVKGSMLRAGGSHGWAINDRWSFSQQIGAFYDTGAFGFAEGTLAEWNAQLLFAVTPKLSLGVTAKCAAPIALSFDDGREGDCTGGLVSVTSF